MLYVSPVEQTADHAEGSTLDSARLTHFKYANEPTTTLSIYKRKEVQERKMIWSQYNEELY